MYSIIKENMKILKKLKIDSRRVVGIMVMIIK